MYKYMYTYTYLNVYILYLYTHIHVIYVYILPMYSEVLYYENNFDKPIWTSLKTLDGWTRWIKTRTGKRLTNVQMEGPADRWKTELKSWHGWIKMDQNGSKWIKWRDPLILDSEHLSEYVITPQKLDSKTLILSSETISVQNLCWLIIVDYTTQSTGWFTGISLLDFWCIMVQMYYPSWGCVHNPINWLVGGLHYPSYLGPIGDEFIQSTDQIIGLTKKGKSTGNHRSSHEDHGMFL